MHPLLLNPLAGKPKDQVNKSIDRIIMLLAPKASRRPRGVHQPPAR